MTWALTAPSCADDVMPHVPTLPCTYCFSTRSTDALSAADARNRSLSSCATVTVTLMLGGGLGMVVQALARSEVLVVGMHEVYTVSPMQLTAVDHAPLLVQGAVAGHSEEHPLSLERIVHDLMQQLLCIALQRKGVHARTQQYRSTT